MKTKEINLRKKILLAELPEGVGFGIIDDVLFIDSGSEMQGVLDLDDWVFLGELTELQDSDVEDLVDYLTDFEGYETPKNYLEGKNGRYERISFIESFMSALEVEVYWENPIPTPEVFKTENGWCLDDSWVRDYDEAESRTFDKSRTLIFVEK